MTDFVTWEKKAKNLVDECEKQEEAEKDASNKDLGIDPDRVEGPPVAAARQQLQELKTISEDRRNLIGKITNKEITLSNVVANKIQSSRTTPNSTTEDAVLEGTSSIAASAEAAAPGAAASTSTTNVDVSSSSTTTTTGARTASNPTSQNNPARGSSSSSLDPETARLVDSTFLEKPGYIEVQAVEKGVRIENAKDSTIRFKGKVWKIFVANCENCRIEVDAEVSTSSSEVYNSKDCVLYYRCAMESVQVDACQRVQCYWSEEAFFKYVVSHACADLEYYFDDKLQEVVVVDDEDEVDRGINTSSASTTAEGASASASQDKDPKMQVQYLTAVEPKTKKLVTMPVQRDAEKEFPVFFGGDQQMQAGAGGAGGGVRPATGEVGGGTSNGHLHFSGGASNGTTTPEANRAAALRKKEEGNAAFKTSDFMQAAAFYTLSLEAYPDPVVLANRAQCWLKTGEFGKAIKDCEEAITLDEGNPKAWFRQGMARHGLATGLEKDKTAEAKSSAEREFKLALDCLGKAEKLDPKNKQITDAIGMVSLKMRRQLAA
ncbi:unnamed protein product [Amoebophrya sp. A120]|nr:unnamed protein product [Amoebophrya sp. A120]|eukprot:GSA120T00000744001.1